MFQPVFNFFKRLRAPRWLKNFFDDVQNFIITVLHEVGEDALRSIEHEIVRVNSESITGRKKFDKVYDFAINKLDLGRISNVVLDSIIQFLVLRLKNKNVI